MANTTTDVMVGSSPKAVTELYAPDAVENLDLNKAQASISTDLQDEKKDDEHSPWHVSSMSQKACRTQNPIRKIVDPIVKNIQSGTERGDGKDHISLALGDPTVGGNLPPCQVALDAVVTAALETPHSAGYINACGLPAAREAIAKHHSYPIAGGQVTADNVIVASGCSGTLELVLTALLDPGTAILVPQPGFPLYQVIAESHGASVVYYRLDPDRNWEIDLNHLQNVLSTTTAAPIRGLLLNNPSNPTGAVYSRQHLRDVVSFCDQHHLPIVADEVYGSLTFGLSEFHPMAKVAAECGNRVPVITTSGLAKQYLLPGWRCGWVVFHDNAFGTLQEVESGAKRLAQIVLGASHLIQRVIPELLPSAPALDEWKQDLKLTLERQAKFIYRRLSICHGLSAIAPQGAMYSMVRIDLSVLDVVDDVDFSTKLLQEENVFVLPGSAFGCPNTFRVVFCCDEPLLEAAADRIDQFCLRHAKPSDAIDRCRR